MEKQSLPYCLCPFIICPFFLVLQKQRFSVFPPFVMSTSYGRMMSSMTQEFSQLQTISPAIHLAFFNFIKAQGSNSPLQLSCTQHRREISRGLCVCSYDFLILCQCEVEHLRSSSTLCQWHMIPKASYTRSGDSPCRATLGWQG